MSPIIIKTVLSVKKILFYIRLLCKNLVEHHRRLNTFIINATYANTNTYTNCILYKYVCMYIRRLIDLIYHSNTVEKLS